jgi:hypothetical protein
MRFLVALLGSALFIVSCTARVRTRPTRATASRGFSARLLPRCLPPPPPTDIYGFHIEVLQIYGKGRLSLNGRALPVPTIIDRLEAAYGSDVNRMLYVSLEGGFYEDLVHVVDSVQPLGAQLLVLTPESRAEFEVGMNRTDCWFQF